MNTTQRKRVSPVGALLIAGEAAVVGTSGKLALNDSTLGQQHKAVSGL